MQQSNPFTMTPDVSVLSDFVRESSCEKEVWSSDPIPDFWEQLPDKLIDPDTGKEIFISQSKLRAFRKVIKDQICPKRFYSCNILNEHEEEEGEGPDVRKMGNRFEFLLTGAPDYSGNYPGELTTAVTKKRAKVNDYIELAAEKARQTLKELGFDQKGSLCQIEVKAGILICHIDAYITRNGKWVILDIKFSGLLDERTKYIDFSWYPGTIKEKLGPKIQMRHYALMMSKDGPEREITMPLPDGSVNVTANVHLFDKAHEANAFIFVSDSRPDKIGEYIPYEISFTEESINQHKHFILETVRQFQRMVEGKEFTAVPSYEKCKRCPLSESCKDYRDRPEVVKIEF